MAEGMIQGGPAPTFYSTAAPESSIRRVGEQLLAAWNAHDIMSFAALFEADAAFVSTDGQLWRGRKQIEAELEMKHRASMRASRMSALGTTHVELLSPNSAVMQVQWELVRLIAPNGSSLPHRNGILLLVLKSDGGSWKIAMAQNTRVSATAD